ncbi:hypothetical protein PEBR_02700 [Penicillium brasilianum]|uniref:Uncharacterized protein n=1 Tax=Penicillium brasilianum TaxID=104259 RepID=A0A1S9S0R7_PENBI|nr:hypothetical protein PEBR_02700 [Penicillium brasilianum]
MSTGDELPYKTVNGIAVPRLRSRNDWPMWKEYIQKTAKICGVWEYCDPANTAEEYREKKATLSEPTFKAVRQDAWSITDLDDVEFKKLHLLVIEYREKKAEVAKKRDAIGAIKKLIARSASPKYEKYITGLNPYRQLTALSKVFSSPSVEDINQISSEWLALQQLGEKADIQDYVTRWKVLFKKCLDLNLVNGSQEEALGKSLMDSQNLATMWKPLQFQSWFEQAGILDLDSEDADTWVPALELNTEADGTSEDEDENYDDSWTSEAVENSDDEGEDAW